MDKYHKGFTFIELLVVVGVIVITVGISLAYYNNFTEDTKIKTATTNLVNVLNLAQKRASSGDTANAVCTNFAGYSVTFAANQYTLSMKCSPACSGSLCQQIYNLPSNLTLTTPINTFTFKPLAGTDLLSDLSINISNGNNCRAVNVNVGGLVSEDSACPL